MSLEIIQQRLESYACGSRIEEEQAIREITQEVVLAALGRTEFFGHAAFHGGTCLRIGDRRQNKQAGADHRPGRYGENIKAAELFF